MKHLSVALCAAVLIGPGPAPAQTKDNRPWAFLSANPAEPAGKPAPQADLLLRPNVASQPYYLYVHNPTDVPLPMTVEVRAGGRVLASVTTARLGNGTHRVALDKVPAPPPEGIAPVVPPRCHGARERLDDEHGVSGSRRREQSLAHSRPRVA